MPTGEMKFYNVEILPNRDQRKWLRTLEKEIGFIKANTLDIFTVHYNEPDSILPVLCPLDEKISGKQTPKELAEIKNKLFQTIFEKLETTNLLETSIQHVIQMTYEQFLTLAVAFKGGKISLRITRCTSVSDLKIPVDQIEFFTSESYMKIPYIGKTRYRPNKRFKIGCETGISVSDDVGKSLPVRSARIASMASKYYVEFDCRDEIESEKMIHPVVLARMKHSKYVSL